jgi:hypothetical protein
MVTQLKLTSRKGIRKIALPVCAVVIALAMTAGTPANAASLTINFTFDSTIAANFGANAANFQNAFNTAAANLTSLYTDPINVNINVTSVAGTGILGQSNTPIFSTAFTTMRNALAADSKSADDATTTGVGGSVSSTLVDPIGGNHTYWLTRAQRKALGVAADDLTSDGTITIGAGFAYDFDPSNGITSSTFDLVGVAMHETSEVMGRIGLSGGSVNGEPSYTLVDLMSYKGAGTRGIGNDGGNSFSIDNGTTLLKAFNNQNLLGGDSRDWATGTNDTFNAFANTGVVEPLSAVDVRVMDAIGYDLKQAAVPEPSSMLLIASAVLAGALASRKLKRNA